MNIRFLDYETTSHADLPAIGSYNYVEDPSTRILMAGTARGEEEPHVAENLKDVYQPGETIVSWGSFDRLVAFKIEKFPADWIDASALALYCGLPRSLKDFCKAVGIPATKDARGTRLINIYSRDPDKVLEGADREAFEEYCLQDVRLLQQAWKVLGPLYPEWKQTQEANYWHIEAMNNKGVPIDVAAVAEAISQIREQEARLVAECKELTDGIAPSQTEKIRVFLGLDDIQRSTLATARFDDPVKARVAEIRRQISNATAKKLQPMLDFAGPTGRARGCFTNNGAHTGRGSSQGIQFQNLRRSAPDPEYFSSLHSQQPTEDPLGDAQKNIRGFIYPGPDKRLVVADYAQVEVRVLAWISWDQGLLDLFTAAEDPYKTFASIAFQTPADKITPTERQYGKIAVLGSGYGVGGPGLAKQAVGYGVTLTDKQGWELVKRYRDTFPEVPELWNTLDRNLVKLVAGKIPEFTAGRCKFTVNTPGTVLKCLLPSGRPLRYMFPRIEKHGERTGVVFTSRFGRKMLWGGHVVENLCQAIATDLKLQAMQEFGGEVIAEVHDEIVLETPVEKAEERMKTLLRVMEHPRPWFDKAGLIKAEAKVMERYGK